MKLSREAMGAAWAGMRYPVVNRLFTFACFSTPPPLGSVVSFIWHGGALWCTFEIVSGRRRFSTDRYMLLSAILLYTYVAAGLLSFLLNDPRWESAHTLIPLATLFFFPFSYSIWSISHKDDLTSAAALASMTASYGALALALVQHFILGMRVEGGAGNALVFATVTCMIGSVSLAGALMLTTRWQIPMAGGYLAAVLAVLLSGSRSVWLVMAVVSLAILLVGYRQLRTLLKGRLIKTVAAIAVIATLSSGVLLSRVESLSANWAEMAENGEYDSSLGLRLALWKVGADRFLERPLLGNGPHHTRQLIENGLADDFDLSARFTHFHNGFLTLLVETGLIGGGAVIMLFLLVAWVAIRTLATSREETARFGAIVLLIFFLNYTLGGSFNLILGHDIIDTMFMIFLIAGLFLARGTSMLEGKIAEVETEDQAQKRDVHGNASKPIPRVASPTNIPTMTRLPAAR
ncbi:O-antigen ligase family protein [Chelativorans salis]|uniref:O-antigen ligase family protein n=1 Tax=Chelativorans salis TaxID=2978478 RepID=A0ABT2LMA3_9HYPH|nr:O-antigen ligase [Chelativorans sp. EGI FJ00035]MCT7375653.1 O-antigen ligase family protein [Chelativorans sp. EGI FJ00035]